MTTRALLNLAALAALTPLASACSSASEEPASRGGDALVVEAQATTRSELGVVTWGIDTGKGTSTVVRGYDAGHTAVIEFEQEMTQGVRRSFQASLRRNGSLAKMKLEIEPSPTSPSSQSLPSPALKTIENTFGSDAEAHRVLARIIADLAAQPARAQTQNAAAASGLHAAGLIENPGTTLLSKCDSALVGSASAGANTADACSSSGDTSGDCASRVQKMPQSQDQVDQNCTCDGAPADQGPTSSCAPQRANCAVPAMHRALLDTIAFTEGTAGSCGNDGYSTGFGYNCFDSCANHPHIVWGSSSAAGRYQFLDFVWDELGLPDFGPANQDKAAIMKVRQRGVDLPTDRPLSESEFEDAMHKLSKEWASLPFSPYGQPVKTLTETRARYCEAAGGC